MTNQRLLAHLLGRLNRPPEPTATAALSFVLGRSPHAASALADVVRATGVQVPSGLRFVAESGRVDEGRPDITGYEGEGEHRRARLIVEAKFDARLADSQITQYLGWFEDDAPSVLVLLAPEHRLRTLWREALAQLPEGQADVSGVDGPTSASPLGTDRFVRLTAQGHALTAISWRSLLSSIRERVDGAGDADVMSDVRQLESLIDVYEQTSFVPLSEEDLDLHQARTFEQTMRLFWKLRNELASSGMSCQGNVRYGHDWLASTHITPERGKKFEVVRGTELWLLSGSGPLWVTVWPSSELPLNDLAAVLRPLETDDRLEVFMGERTVRVPLLLKRNSGETAVLADLVRQVGDVSRLLDSHIEPSGPGIEAAPIDESAAGDLGQEGKE